MYLWAKLQWAGNFEHWRYGWCLPPSLAFLVFFEILWRADTIFIVGEKSPKKYLFFFIPQLFSCDKIRLASLILGFMLSECEPCHNFVFEVSASSSLSLHQSCCRALGVLSLGGAHELCKCSQLQSPPYLAGASWFKLDFSITQFT